MHRARAQGSSRGSLPHCMLHGTQRKLTCLCIVQVLSVDLDNAGNPRGGYQPTATARLGSVARSVFKCCRDGPCRRPGPAACASRIAPQRRSCARCSSWRAGTGTACWLRCCSCWWSTAARCCPPRYVRPTPPYGIRDLSRDQPAPPHAATSSPRTAPKRHRTRAHHITSQHSTAQHITSQHSTARAANAARRPRPPARHTRTTPQPPPPSPAPAHQPTTNHPLPTTPTARNTPAGLDLPRPRGVSHLRHGARAARGGPRQAGPAGADPVRHAGGRRCRGQQRAGGAGP